MAKGRSQPGSRRKRHIRLRQQPKFHTRRSLNKRTALDSKGHRLRGNPASTPIAAVALKHRMQVQRSRDIEPTDTDDRDDDHGEMSFAIGFVGGRSFGWSDDRGPGRQRMLEECARMRSTSRPGRCLFRTLGVNGRLALKTDLKSGVRIVTDQRNPRAPRRLLVGRSVASKVASAEADVGMSNSGQGSHVSVAAEFGGFARPHGAVGGPILDRIRSVIRVAERPESRFVRHADGEFRRRKPRRFGAAPKGKGQSAHPDRSRRQSGPCFRQRPRLDHANGRLGSAPDHRRRRFASKSKANHHGSLCLRR